MSDMSWTTAVRVVNTIKMGCVALFDIVYGLSPQYKSSCLPSYPDRYLAVTSQVVQVPNPKL